MTVRPPLPAEAVSERSRARATHELMERLDLLARTADDRLYARLAFDVAVVCACIVLAISLGAATLRRRTD